jgi:adsorption protein B
VILVFSSALFMGALLDLAVEFASAWPAFFGGLAGLLLLSGLDDLIPVLICVVHRLRRNPVDKRPNWGAERRIAIFVPCWNESDVIGNMVRHNLASIRYRNFDFFLGVYPNDEPTLAVSRQLAEAFGNVHVAECAHPGPTSKADCLNWIYQRMLLFEQEQNAHFEIIVLHDAEDLIHPGALPAIDCEAAHYQMIQIPVLPLPTSFFEITHGVYCDEFSEFQTIDMPARQFSGAFIPSNGVGTGFAREILDRLAAERHNLVFDPASLTEDYEIGVYIHECGYRQTFVDLHRGERGFIATREYFPRRIRTAVRQRTRWVTGIALQTWERTGWRGTAWNRYWFWRDRKGLLANPLSFLTNILFAVGLLDWFVCALRHQPWTFEISNPEVVVLCWTTLLLQCLRLIIRMLCVQRIYRWSFALWVPLRCLHGNLINCCASLRAIWRYVQARIRQEKLVWQKTEHAYPNRDALLDHRRDLQEVLVDYGYVSREQVEYALQNIPPETNLADFLVSSGVLTEEALSKALSLQSGMPVSHVDHRKVRSRIARILPAHIEKRFGIVPFGLDSGKLLVAGPRVPSSTAFDEINSYTRLKIEFQLVTKQNYDELRAVLYN